MSLIFDKIVGLAQEKGFIQRRTKERIDATHIISHVNRISTTDLLFRAVRCVVEIQTPHQTIFDPRDPSLKLGKKGKTSCVGSKCHVVETAEKGNIDMNTLKAVCPAGKKSASTSSDSRKKEINPHTKLRIRAGEKGGSAG